MANQTINKQLKSEWFDFEISGDLAMFLSPASKQSCEWYSYKFPTYSSLVGILRKIYSFPAVVWHVEKIRIVNPIQFVAMPIKSPHYYGEENRSRYNHTYLYDVCYQLRAYYTLDWSGDHKYCNWEHGNAIRKRIENGHNVINLGKNGCVGFVRPCEFGSGKGYYDSIEEEVESFMFFEFDGERDINGNIKKIEEVLFANYRMLNGVINFSDISVRKRGWNKNAIGSIS